MEVFTKRSRKQEGKRYDARILSVLAREPPAEKKGLTDPTIGPGSSKKEASKKGSREGGKILLFRGEGGSIEHTRSVGREGLMGGGGACLIREGQGAGAPKWTGGVTTFSPALIMKGSINKKGTWSQEESVGEKGVGGVHFNRGIRGSRCISSAGSQVQGSTGPLLGRHRRKGTAVVKKDENAEMNRNPWKKSKKNRRNDPQGPKEREHEGEKKSSVLCRTNLR